MKRLIATLSLSVLASAATAAEVLREVSWGRLKQEAALPFGDVRAADESTPFEYLEVRNAEAAGRTVTLLTLEGPGITKARYAITGRVRYEGIEGKGSWAGSRDRSSVASEGRGGEAGQARGVGGIAGSVIGCIGALIGRLAQRGKGRGLALGLLKGMISLGAVSLGFGAVALLRSQPYEVVYPLLLSGAICLALPLALLPTLRRRYEELELRKMRAQDLASRNPA